MALPKSIHVIKVWVVVLTLWSVGLLVPEFARVATPYPTLGFKADNDGVISSIDHGQNSSADTGIHVGDCIDLQRTPTSDRMVVFGSMGGASYVMPGTEVTLYIAPGSCKNAASRAVKHVVRASQVPMSDANRVALATTQILGLFFVLLAAILVWQQPGKLTFGFFLYSLWFNPGQTFVSYAWLVMFPYLLVPQQILQSLAQALGYAGFVAFAMRFPHENVSPPWHIVERGLPGLVVVLFLLQLVSFGASYGWQTESLSRWSYYFGYAIDIGVLLILRQRTQSQSPQDRQRTRWVHWGCRIGLAAFIFADSNMSTGLWAAAWRHACNAPIGALVCTDQEPSETFLLCCYMFNATVALAVFHAVRKHRVLDVTLALSRGATLLVTSLSIAATLVLLSLPIEDYLHDSLSGRAFFYVLIVATMKLAFDKLNEWLTNLCDQWFFKRIFVAKEVLNKVKVQLKDASTHHQVNAQLIDGCIKACALTGALVQYPPKTKNAEIPADHTETSTNLSSIKCGLPQALIEKLVKPPFVVWLKHDELALSLQGGNSPALALSILGCDGMRAILLCGARSSGDILTKDEVSMLSEVALAAGAAHDRLELMALRERLRLRAA